MIRTGFPLTVTAIETASLIASSPRSKPKRKEKNCFEGSFVNY